MTGECRDHNAGPRTNAPGELYRGTGPDHKFNTMIVTVDGVKNTREYDVSIKYKTDRWGSETGHVRGPGTKSFKITPGVSFSPNIRLKNNSGERISAYICVDYR